VARDSSGGRAFSGLFLTFALSFVNLIGIIFTLTALGGLAPWSRWQFIGAFGLLEAAAGLANVISPNLWRLPIAEIETTDATQVELAGSALLLPHWAALARVAAGALLMGIAAWHEGLSPASLVLIPLVVAMAWIFLLVSAGLARLALLRPEIDVAQVTLRWGGRAREFRPVSISAAVLQFLLSIVTIPAAKLLDPSVLYQPELAPSAQTLVGVLAIAAILTVLVFLLWSGRIALSASSEQQHEAEEHA
jgi:hypothetical protein